MQNRIQDAQCQVHWSKAAPLALNCRGAWRAQKGATPGVAILWHQSLRVVPAQPYSAEGLLWQTRGRLIMARATLRATQVLLVNVYCKSGATSEAQEERVQMQQDVLQELTHHRAIPIILGGDWNDAPEQHMLTTTLSALNWQRPTHVDQSRTSLVHHTYRSAGVESMID
eukprot:213554-Amphidinium_carterae.1